MSMKIDVIGGIDFAVIQRVLTATDISEAQKVRFFRDNRAEIHNVISEKISGAEFSQIMKNRPLIKYRPFKNSLTKRGDKLLLAKTLNIHTQEVNGYVNDFVMKLKVCDHISNNIIPKDELDAVKAYVYRHGKKQQVLDVLEYELFDVKNTLQILYQTLNYNGGGVADYFLRPIHRLDNKTMISIYNIVDRGLFNAKSSGVITDAQHQETARWALAQIYTIQNNQRLRNAVKAYQALN